MIFSNYSQMCYLKMRPILKETNRCRMKFNCLNTAIVALMQPIGGGTKPVAISRFDSRNPKNQFLVFRKKSQFLGFRGLTILIMYSSNSGPITAEKNALVQSISVILKKEIHPEIERKRQNNSLHLSVCSQVSSKSVRLREFINSAAILGNYAIQFSNYVYLHNSL